MMPSPQEIFALEREGNATEIVNRARLEAILAELGASGPLREHARAGGPVFTRDGGPYRLDTPQNRERFSGAGAGLETAGADQIVAVAPAVNTAALRREKVLRATADVYCGVEK